MEIIPAIYILNGKCVALYKSSYEQKETYYRTPVEMARGFQKEGAKKIYVVDLNGKLNNTFQQREIIGEVIRSVSVPVMIEAGFRTLEIMEDAFRLGASQIVIRPPSLTIIDDAVAKFGSDKILALIQAKGSDVVQPKEQKLHPYELDVVDYAENLAKIGVTLVVYKDELSEGTLIQPNYDEVDRLYLTTGKSLKIYVSGGISEIKQLKLLKKIGASAAIIGKAFYEKMLTIREAEEAVEEE